MNNLQLKKGLGRLGKYVNRNSANILTGFGIAGVVTTTIMGIKATPKALRILEEKQEYKIENYNEPLTKFEKALVLTPVYLPTILMGAATMSCIYGANHINKKQQAILSGAYTYLNSCYNDYRNKVKELYGEDADDNVKNAIAQDKYMEKYYKDKERPDKKLCYDEYSGRYFYLNVNELPQTLYNLNKLYNFTGELTLNDVYEYFDLEKTDLGGVLGWAATKDWECAGFSWIDIQLKPIEMPDNLDCYGIEFNIEPSEDYVQWTW